MTNIYEQIKQNNRIARMRMGQEAPTLVSPPSAPEVRIAMVPLLEHEHEKALTEAASLELPDNPYGIDRRDRTLQAATLFYSLRDPEDIEQMAFPNAQKMVEVLESADINHLLEEYSSMVDFSSPSIDGITDEQLDEIKKALTRIDLRGLYGKPWWHLKQFLSTLSVDQLPGRSLGPLSIPSSMTTSDDDESIPGAKES